MAVVQPHQPQSKSKTDQNNLDYWILHSDSLERKHDMAVAESWNAEFIESWCPRHSNGLWSRNIAKLKNKRQVKGFKGQGAPLIWCPTRCCSCTTFLGISPARQTWGPSSPFRICLRIMSSPISWPENIWRKPGPGSPGWLKNPENTGNW